LIELVRANPNLQGYVEKHHILPVSLGGTNEADNLIDLTARQHFLAHWLLWKALDSKEMASAFVLMTHRMSNRRGKDYEQAKVKHAESMSIKFTGSKRSDELKAKMSAIWKGVPKTEPQREAMRRSNKRAMLGKTLSDETKTKMSEARTGATHSEDVKEKIRQAALNKPKTACTHCGTLCAPHTLKRFHMDNCKILRNN
jgi:hypothetical protein